MAEFSEMRIFSIVRNTIAAGVLCLSASCGTIKPFSACIKTGVLGEVVNLDICGQIGDGEFNPEIDISPVQPAPAEGQSGGITPDQPAPTTGA